MRYITNCKQKTFTGKIGIFQNCSMKSSTFSNINQTAAESSFLFISFVTTVMLQLTSYCLKESLRNIFQESPGILVSQYLVFWGTRCASMDFNLICKNDLWKEVRYIFQDWGPHWTLSHCWGLYILWWSTACFKAKVPGNLFICR